MKRDQVWLSPSSHSVRPRILWNSSQGVTSCSQGRSGTVSSLDVAARLCPVDISRVDVDFQKDVRAAPQAPLLPSCLQASMLPGKLRRHLCC